MRSHTEAICEAALSDQTSLTTLDSRRIHRRQSKLPPILRLGAWRLLALGWLALGLTLVANYPFGSLAPAIGAVAYLTLLWTAPLSWLLAVPAILPLASFMPWTGWILGSEFQIVLTLTLAVGYWKAPERPLVVNLNRTAQVAIAVLTISYGISMVLGLSDATLVRGSLFWDYTSGANTLRIASGFLGALLLLPLLVRDAGPGLSNIGRLFVPGVVAGVALTGLVILWERIAFTGLLDFSREYRVTGPFFEMHVGGAALDGYLALGLPITAVWVMRQRRPGLILAGCGILTLAIYAALTTFSRGLYAGLLVGLGILVYSALARRAKELRAEHTATILVAVVVVTGALAGVFGTGGYRGLAAALGACAVGMYAGVHPARALLRWTTWAAIAVLAAVSVTVVTVLPKGAYVAFGISVALVGLSAIGAIGQKFRRNATLAYAGFIWVALNALLVAFHWGEWPAAQSMLLLLLVAAALVVTNAAGHTVLWQWKRNDIIVALVSALVVGLTIPVVGNYFMKSRFADTSRDLVTRQVHWQQSLDLIGDGWIQQLFGMGLGRYPDVYFWKNSVGETPGIVLHREEGGNGFVRIAGPRTKQGWGEPIRVVQRVSLDPGQTYQLRLRFRANAANARLDGAVCEKWLLYFITCAPKALAFTAKAAEEWQEAEMTFSSGSVGSWSWFGRRPAQLAFEVLRSGFWIDIDDVQLLDASGRNLIANGTFSGNPDRWFYTSDHNHLPWHAKNMLLSLLFDQGWLGALSFSALFALAAIATWRLAAHPGDPRVAWAAALGGFFVVGMFDSLLDVDRIAVLFYLVLLTGLLVTEQRPSRHTSS